MLSKIEAVRSALQNKKTHIVVAFAILGVLAEKWLGIDVPGYTVGEDWVQDILIMLGFSTVRAGVSKVQG